MSKRRIMAGTVAMCAILSISAYALEDYKDPRKFAEKYVREDIERNYPGHIYNPILQYKGFELVNVRSEMYATGSGPLSRIVCEFRVIPEDGVEYYERDTSFEYVRPSRLGQLPQEVPEAGLTSGRITDLDDKIRAFCDRMPSMVKKTDISLDPDDPDVVYVCRVRNEDGVYVPLHIKDEVGVFSYEGVDGKYNTNTLFSTRMVKEMGAFDSASEAGRAAYEAYTQKCVEVSIRIKALNDAVSAFNSVTNSRWGNTSFAQVRRRELTKELIAPLKEELSGLESELKQAGIAAKRKARGKPHAKKSVAIEKQNLEKSLLRLESRRKSLEENIESLRQPEPANPGRGRGSRQRVRAAKHRLPQLEAELASVVQKLEEGRARLQRLTEQRAEIKAEEQAAAAEAEKAQAEISAKIADVKKKIEDQKESIDVQLSAEVNARLNQHKGEIERQVDALEGLLK